MPPGGRLIERGDGFYFDEPTWICERADADQGACRWRGAEELACTGPIDARTSGVSPTT